MTDNRITDNQIVATGASYSAIPHDEHARHAVQQARSQMPECTVGSVLLFLSSAYAHKPQNAIKEAVKAAGTPLVFGCCAMSLLTEKEWLLDVEGAVAMVFPSELCLQPLTMLQQHKTDPNLVITLATPNAATIAVNTHTFPQIGAITSDEYGHGPFSVWQSGRIVEHEFVQAAFPSSLQHSVHVAEGVKHISPIMQINRSKNHQLIETDQQPAVDNLLKHLPHNLHATGLKQPYNVLCAISENTDPESIKQGHYRLQHVVATDNSSKQIHLSGTAKAGNHMFWALRDNQLAQITMRQKLEQAKSELQETPKFALMFPNIGRGPEFFNGRDRDLELFQEAFPKTPLIGFYGNGEISPGHHLAGLIHHYSTVFSIFA